MIDPLSGLRTLSPQMTVASASEFLATNVRDELPVAVGQRRAG
jgi:hypothetical protein